MFSVSHTAATAAARRGRGEGPGVSFLVQIREVGRSSRSDMDEVLGAWMVGIASRQTVMSILLGISYLPYSVGSHYGLLVSFIPILDNMVTQLQCSHQLSCSCIALTPVYRPAAFQHLRHCEAIYFQGCASSTTPEHRPSRAPPILLISLAACLVTISTIFRARHRILRPPRRTEWGRLHDCMENRGVQFFTTQMALGMADN